MKKVLIVILIFIFLLISIGTIQATEITDMNWISNMAIIEIVLDRFPSTWGDWVMYIYGEKIPMEGGTGKPVIRPNAPLDAPPTGLIIGTEPWATGLGAVDFPCYGTIQFYIPGEGFTNEYGLNLVTTGCGKDYLKE